MDNCIVVDFNKYKDKSLAEKDFVSLIRLLSNMNCEILISSPMEDYYECRFHSLSDDIQFLEVNDEERDMLSLYRSGDNI